MQAPDTIRHGAAGGGAGGELYTVVDKPKKGGKKANDKSENGVAQLYAMPDKSKKKQNQDQGVCRYLHICITMKPIHSDHLWATKRWRWSLFIEIKKVQAHWDITKWSLMRGGL